MDANHFVEIHVTGVHGYRVSLAAVQFGDCVANLHIPQRQVDLSVRTDAEHQGREHQKKRFD